MEATLLSRKTKRDPNARKVVLSKYPEFEKPGHEKDVLCNYYGQFILAEDVKAVLDNPLWPEFDKNNRRNKLRMLESGRVTSEFATVYDFKKPRKTAGNKRRLPVSSYIRFPVRNMSEQRELVHDSEGLRIIKNDCGAELDQMDAQSISVAVTSPPYNIGIDYNTYEDTKTNPEYIQWMQDIGRKLHRVLKDDGSFFLNVGGTNKDPGIPHRVCKAFEDAGFVLQNEIIWVKSISILHEPPEAQFKKMLKDLGLTVKDLKSIKPDLDLSQLEAEVWRTHGHFKPINSKRFLNNCHESVFHFTKDGNGQLDRLAIGVPYEHKSNISRWKHNTEDDGSVRDLRCKGNVWHIPYKTVMSAKEHPAGYPSQLAEECIKLHGVDDTTIVLDPFLGAGSTLMACKNLGVAGIGIEIDKAYCQMAKEKLVSGD